MPVALLKRTRLHKLVQSRLEARPAHVCTMSLGTELFVGGRGGRGRGEQEGVRTRSASALELPGERAAARAHHGLTASAHSRELTAVAVTLQETGYERLAAPVAGESRPPLPGDGPRKRACAGF